MARIKGKISLKFESPVRVGSGHGFAWRFDHTLVRDAQGLPVIPASTIKGRLRYLCKRVALTLNYEPEICQTMDREEACKPDPDTNKKNLCIICRIFGSRFREGKLRFSDAHLPPAEGKTLRVRRLVRPGPFFPEAEARTQVKLSRVRRVAEPQLLFCGEVAPRGFVFMAQVQGKLSNEELELLTWGLQLFTHLGAQKSQGLGRCQPSLILE